MALIYRSALKEQRDMHWVELAGRRLVKVGSWGLIVIDTNQGDIKFGNNFDRALYKTATEQYVETATDSHLKTLSAMFVL